MRFSLEKGIQTGVSSLVIKEAEKIKGENADFILNALGHLVKNFSFVRSKPIERRRHVDEIILSKNLGGCTEAAHLFVSLCRAKKIPCNYIEAIDRNWLKNEEPEVKGHVFVRVKLDDLSFLVDPMNGMVKFKDSFNNFIPIGEGIDYGSLYPSDKDFFNAIKNAKLGVQ